jgi:5-methylcytosine-specific restriction endonuclease McrA
MAGLNKVCNKCHRELPIDNFGKRSLPSGTVTTRPYCRECSRKMYAEYYHQNGGRETVQKYYLEHREELLPKLRKRFGKSPYNPIKQPARMAVFRAIKSGRLIKPPKCQLCGNTGRIEAHHFAGYSKEHYLDVEWLCSECHHRADNPEFAVRIENHRMEVAHA